MRRRTLVCIFTLFCTAITSAQETEMQVAMEAAFAFETFQNAEGNSTWRTGERAKFGIRARSGNNLVVEARVESDFSGGSLTGDQVLRELSLSWSPASFAILTAGKQNLKWGTARAFSSIDALDDSGTTPAPSTDPLDPSSTARGVTGLRADILPVWWMSISALALPAPVLLDSKLALRSEFLVGETDLAFGFIRSVGSNGKEQPAFIADGAHFFQRFGVYGEAQVLKKDDWRTSATGGLQVDFPAWLNGTVTFLGEYRFKQENTAGIHMIYAGLSGIPLTRKLEAGISLLAAPDERQALCRAGLDWKISQSMSADVGYEYLVDANTSETGHIYLFSDNPLMGSRHCVSAGVTAFY